MAKSEKKKSPYLSTDKLLKQCVDAVKEHGLIFFDELVAYVPCSRATLYNHGIDKMDELKDVIEANRVAQKAGLRKKWYEGDNATTQIALYKLTSTETERKLLSTSYQHQTVKQEQPLFPDVPADDSDQSVTDSE